MPGWIHYIYLDPGRNSRPIGQVDPTSGNVYFTHTDRQGTPRLLTDASQNIVWSAAYNPFGDTSGLSGTLTTQSLRLPGQYFDPETGNNHNGFRDYAGTLTRYVQSDPIGLRGGMNTYQYVRGNPFKYTDRLGLDPNGGGGGGSGSNPCSSSWFSFIGTACAQPMEPDLTEMQPDSDVMGYSEMMEPLAESQADDNPWEDTMELQTYDGDSLQNLLSQPTVTGPVCYPPTPTGAPLPPGPVWSGPNQKYITNKR